MRARSRAPLQRTAAALSDDALFDDALFPCVVEAALTFVGNVVEPCGCVVSSHWESVKACTARLSRCRY